MQPSSVPDIPGLERLGEGGMGTVYRARQTANKREVAIKFLTAAIAGADEENRSRFQREAQIETLDKALAHAPENMQSMLKGQKSKYEQLQAKKR